jgi:hypothetical protein
MGISGSAGIHAGMGVKEDVVGWRRHVTGGGGSQGPNCGVEVSDLESVDSLAVSVVDRDKKRVERSRATLKATRPKRRPCPKTGSQVARGHSFTFSKALQMFTSDRKVPKYPQLISRKLRPRRMDLTDTLSEPHPLPDLRYSQRNSRHRQMLQLLPYSPRGISSTPGLA